jgi:hypothetical protein
LTSIQAAPSEEFWQDYGKALILNVAVSKAPASGQLYIVDRHGVGSDENAGTYEAPMENFHTALEKAKPGDTILMRGGYYAWNQPALKKFNGEEGKWLTLSSFPGETPVIEAYGVHFDPSQRPYGEGPSVLGNMQHDTGIIHIWGDPDYTRIQGFHVHNSRRAAISVYGKRDPNHEGPRNQSWGVTDHVDISFNDTWQAYTMGVISHFTNHLSVIGNRIVRPHSLQMGVDAMTGNRRSFDHGSQEAIDLTKNDPFEIAFNTVVGGGKEAIDCIAVENGLVHHNYVESSLNGIYIDSWSVPIRHMRIYRNFINNAFNGIPLATEGSQALFDFDIHHNIVIDAKSDSINVTEATYRANRAKVQQQRVYNNTTDKAGGHAIAIGWQSSGIRVAGFRDNKDFRDIDIWNNIVTNSYGMPMSNSYSPTKVEQNITFTHNMVWPTKEDSTPEWMRRKDKGWQAIDLETEDATLADPMYVNPERGDYRLKAGSPAIKAGRDGEDLGALPYGSAWIPGLDFAGNTTSFYQPQTQWKPLQINPRHFTLHRNNLQRPSWFQRNRYGVDFRNLPDGEVSMAGVTYHIASDARSSGPNVLSIAGHTSEVAEAEIKGIEVGRKATKLAFLHNAHIGKRSDLKVDGTPEGGQIFRYVVNYKDGSSVDIPIRLGVEIDDWLHRDLRTIEDGAVAWTEPVDRRRFIGALSVYSYEWENPKPDVQIDTINIVRTADRMKGTPAVFAISTGH